MAAKHNLINNFTHFFDMIICSHPINSKIILIKVKNLKATVELAN